MSVAIDFRGYNGNSNLKKSRQPFVWTNDLVEEYAKCKYDPIYFAEKYINIVHVDRGFIPIELYDYQKEIVIKYQNSRRVVVVTSRQAGKTTTAVAIILHFILFNDHKRVALLANKGASAREILDRIKIAYEALPPWVQQGVLEWNKGSISLENGCQILAEATTSTSIRGKFINLLYIDEAAFVENWDEFFASVYPTISSGTSTKILLTSTPNGLNHFHKTIEGSKFKETEPEKWNGYELIEVPWNKVPGRGHEWYIDTLKSMNYDYEKFEVEFNCQFQGSSGTLISGSVLKNLVSKNPLWAKDGLTVYKEPEEKHQYSMVVDTSRGKGLDYSAFQIIDITKMPYEQVCVFRNNMITPVEYAEVIHRASKKYNDAGILVENNDVGAQVADLLYDTYEVESLICTESAGSRGKRIASGYKNGFERGLRTTKTVKALGCSMLKLLVEQYQLIINDQQTIFELSRFSRKGTSYEAESGCNDDLVMCLVLFAWMTDQQYFKELTDINTLVQLREKTEEEIENALLDFYVDDRGNQPVEEEIIDFVPGEPLHADQLALLRM